MKTSNLVFSRPGAKWAIDTAYQTASGEFVTSCSSQTLEQLRQRENDDSIVLIEMDDFIASIEAGYLNAAPTEITASIYDEMCNCLPPMNYTQNSFQMSEFTSGRITEGFIHYGNRFWRMYVIGGTPVAEMIKRVQAAQKRFTLFDRSFAVLAEFPEADADQANAYMESHPGACVLAVADGRIIIADKSDKGVAQ